MLVIREVPGAGQFDPNNPATGLIDLSVVAPGYPEVPWVIKSGGYNSTGAPHAFVFFLAPLGPLIPGGPRIDLLAADPANTGTICPVAIPRDDNFSWTLRFETVGKADLGTLSIYLLQEGV